MRLTRRRFGQGMGASLALTTTALRAHDGPHEVEVEIEDFVFVPAMIEILAGDSVVWINKDIAPHTATAESGNWETDTLEQGDRGRVTFDKPGEYPYFCVYHTHMRGIVRVSSKNGA